VKRRNRAKLIWWLSSRGIKPRRGEGFFSFVFFIAVLGVVVGVAALIIVNSVMTGFQSAIKERLLSSNADIIVMKTSGNFYEYDYAERKVSELNHVKGVSPFIYLSVMASSDSASFGASLRGCDPEKEGKVTDIPKHIVMGDWELLKSADNGVIIGKALAEELGVSIGDTVTVISPLGRKTPFGFMPLSFRFRIVGIFEVGMYQFDSGLILARMDTVRKAFGIGDFVTGLMVKLDDPENAKLVESEIERTLGEKFVARDWIEMNKNLFSALKLEKLAMFLILTLIVVVASFNISSLLMMNVNYKSKEIAILKTLGGESSLILKVFMFQGFIIGLFGTVVGEVIGILVSLLGEKYKLISLPTDIYYIDHLPFQLHVLDCIFAAVAAVIISIVATIYPARKAAITDPVKILRMGET
jgi:lipoprotein-releasing system permease protein